MAVALARCSFASFNPALTAFSANSEPSVAIRMCLYMLPAPHRDQRSHPQHAAMGGAKARTHSVLTAARRGRIRAPGPKTHGGTNAEPNRIAAPAASQTRQRYCYNQGHTLSPWAVSAT